VAGNFTGESTLENEAKAKMTNSGVE